MPAENLREQIGRLRALAPELNAVTDKAALLIQAVEKFLDEECKFGLSAHAVMGSEEIGDGAEGQTWLEYTRVDGRFRICVTEILCDPTGEYHTRSRAVWASCPREWKLGSVDHIPDLLSAVGKRVENTIKSGKSAVETVDQFLQAMEVGR